MVHAFDVLGDPVRRGIVELLADGEQTSGAIAAVIQAEFGISPPGVSQHHQRDARCGRTSDDNEQGRQLIDIVNQIAATHREIGNSPLTTGDGRSLLLRRGYDATIEDVWDACATPDRISRWLAPITGDLRPGGTFQLEGNAGGQILRCEQPHLLKVTWTMGEGMATEVEVRLSPGPDSDTVLELVHAAPAEIVDEMARTYGPGGTIGIGGGWDLALLGLDLHLRGVELDPATWEHTPEVKEFATRSCHAWGSVIQLAWGTSDEDIAAAIAFGAQHYAPETTRDEDA